MAITKILHISENKDWAPKHLKTAIEYITNPEKTGGGRYVCAVGCIPKYAFEQMVETKKSFAKTDKRQGYHIIISFREGEVDAHTAFEIVDRFANEYLGNGKGFEAVYSIHTDTDHIHGHIIFNSVNKKTGKKYSYKKGDWAKYIQPITNRLCEEYGLSTLRLETAADRKLEASLNDRRGQKTVWSDMIRRDIDTAVIRAIGYDDFLQILETKGYEIKEGEYLSLRPPGMARFRRTQTLGERYTTEELKHRIETETLHTYSRVEPTILKVNIPYHLKRAKLSGMQKKYFKRLYETGKLRKHPYSEAWKYRDDIRRFHKMQAEYLFLAKYEIHTGEELKNTGIYLTGKKKERDQTRRQINKEKSRFKSLFEIVKRIDQLTYMEESYLNGDPFFYEDHLEYQSLKKRLADQGYTVEDLKELENHYTALLKENQNKYKGLNADIRTYKEIAGVELGEVKKPEKNREKEKAAYDPII